MLKNSWYVYLIWTFENQCLRSIFDNLPKKIVQSVEHNVNTTSKCMALKSWAIFVHRAYSIKFIVRCVEIWQFLHKKVGSGRIGSTLEIDSGHNNKKIGYYPKSLRPFLRILCVVEDSIYAC